MQPAGQDRARAQRQRRRGEIGQADHPHAKIKQAHRAADCSTYERKHPVCADKILRQRPRRMRHRQPGQEGDRGYEIVEPVIHEKESA
jgi:hypothetical protein